MTRGRWPAAGMLAHALPVLGLALQPTHAVAQSRMPENFTLEDADRVLENFRNQIWTLSEVLAPELVDAAGHTLARDLADHLLSDATQARLATWRTETDAQLPPDKRVPRAAFEKLDAIMTPEACRLTVVMDYWSNRAARPVHEQLVRRQLPGLPAAEQAQAEAQMVAVGRELDGLRPAMESKVQACGGTPLPVIETNLTPRQYNTLRNALLARRRELDLPIDSPPPMKRTAACPPGTGRTTGRAGPGAGSSPDMFDFYPHEARQFGIEGQVRVRMDYDATGCVTGVSVDQSSGVPALDEAAMRARLASQLVPGEQAGVAVGGSVLQPMSFSLRDMSGRPPEPAPAQPQP